MFTWTEEKNQLNKKKHGFYLSDIVNVFDDPHLLEFYDEAHSSLGEDRYITFGCFYIITAREATLKEQEVYYEHYKKSTNSGGN